MASLSEAELKIALDALPKEKADKLRELYQLNQEQATYTNVRGVDFPTLQTAIRQRRLAMAVKAAQEEAKAQQPPEPVAAAPAAPAVAPNTLPPDQVQQPEKIEPETDVASDIASLDSRLETVEAQESALRGSNPNMPLVVNWAYRTMFPETRDTETIAKERAAKELSTAIEDQKASLVAAAKEAGQKFPDESAVRDRAAANVMKSSAFLYDGGTMPLSGVTGSPGSTAEGQQFSLAKSIGDYSAAIQRRKLKEWADANPGVGMPAEQRSKLEQESTDEARRELFSIVGTDPSRENAFIPLDPYDKQVEKLRSGKGLGPIPVPIAGAYELATGRPYSESYLSQALTPFLASATPGFSQSDLVDIDGKRIGPATRESWYFSATRSPLTSPIATYLYAPNVKEWGDDAHLEALSQGYDITSYPYETGEMLTPDAVPDPVKGAIGFGAVAIASILDPDIPSLATGGVSEAFKIGKTARRILAGQNAQISDKLAAALADETEELADGATVVGGDLEKYLAEKQKLVAGSGSNVANQEAIMVEYVENAAKLRLGSELGSESANALLRAEEYAGLLKAAEAKARRLGVEASDNTTRLRGAMDVVDDEIRQNVQKAGAAVKQAESTFQLADDLVPGAVRQNIALEGRAADVAANDALSRAQKMVEPRAAAVGEATSDAARAAGRSVRKELSAAEQAQEVAAAAAPRRREFEATRELVMALKADARATAKLAAEKLKELRDSVGYQSFTADKLEEVIERSKTHKLRRAALVEAIDDIKAIKKKSPKDVEDLKQLSKQLRALDRDAFVDVADGEVLGAVERWKIARGAAAASSAMADDLLVRLNRLDPGIVRAERTASAASHKRDNILANAISKKQRDLERARAKFDAADAAYKDAVLRSRDIKGRVPAELQRAVAKSKTGVKRAADVRAKALDALNRAKAQYDDVLNSPMKYLKSNRVRAAFAAQRKSIDALAKLSGQLRGTKKDIAALGRYRQILREEYQKTAEAFRKYEKWNESGSAPGEVARAKVMLDTVANRSSDTMFGFGTFKYGFTSALGFQANITRLIATAKMRTGTKLYKFFDAVSARGFGPMSGDLKDVAERNFGRFRVNEFERNEVAKASTAKRAELSRAGKTLMEELQTPVTPQRRQEILRDLRKLEEQFVAGDLEYITFSTPIEFGKYGDRTVMNAGVSHADRALEYLKLIRSGEVSGTDVVYTSLLRAWMPGGAGTEAAASTEAATRAALNQMIDDSSTGAEFVERLRRGELSAPWLKDTGNLEAHMRAWDFIVRGVLSGSAMRDGLLDLVKAGGPRLTAADAKIFNMMASIPHKGLAKDAFEVMARDTLSTLDKLEGKIADYGTGMTEQMVTAWRLMDSSITGQMRILKVGSLKIGDDVFIPQHVYQALQDIPDRIAKQTTRWDMDGSPAMTLVRKVIAARKLNMVYGTWLPKLRQFFVQPIGDASQAATHAGVGNAVRIMTKSAAHAVPLVGPTFSKFIESTLGPKSILGTATSVDLDRIMKADATYKISTGDGIVSAPDFLREAFEDRMWSGMGTDALQDLAQRTFDGMKSRRSYQKLFDALYEPNRLVTGMADTLEELQKRTRLRMYFEYRTGRITGTPMSRVAAKKITHEQLFDWQLGTLPWENEGIFRLFLFHNYRRASLKHTISLITEPFLEPTGKYLKRAAIGQTKLGRTISANQVAIAAVTAAEHEDPDREVSDHEAYMEFAGQEYPTWAGSVGVMTKDTMSGTESQWYLGKTGRKVTHEAWSSASVQFFEGLYLLHEASNLAAVTSLWAHEFAGGKPSVTHASLTETYRRTVERTADMFIPAVRGTVKAGLDHWSGKDHRVYDELRVNQDTILAARALGLGGFLYENDEGVPVLDGFIANTLSVLADELIPQYRDIVGAVAATQNPGYQESFVEGATESIARYLGVFRRNVYAPGEDISREQKFKAGQIRTEVKDMDPLDRQR